MKKTSLHDQHVALGARMVEFAGWEMPVMYRSIVQEHLDTRSHAGLFDVSHMGEIIVQGADAERYLESIIPTSLDKLYPGKSMYSCFPNEKGGVVDDLFVFMRDEHDYYLVVNAGTRDKDFDWMQNHKKGNMEIVDVSDQTSKIDLQGPKAKDICLKVLQSDSVAGLERFHFTYAQYNGLEIMVSQTGYTGEFGYEIYIENSHAASLWNDLMDAGKEFNISPVGLGARDTLRLESCYFLYGHELNDDISPVEAGLGWLVNSDKEYVGSKKMKKQKEEGAPRKLVCLELQGKDIPREECGVEVDGKEIGQVTSGGHSPTFKKGIAMALVANGAVAVGDTVDIVIRDKRIPALVVKRPFYKYNG